MELLGTLPAFRLQQNGIRSVAKDPTGTNHVARSRTKIVDSAKTVADANRHIAATQKALARSQKLLKRARDPLKLDRR